MKKNIYFILFALTLFLCESFNKIHAQGATCADATQLCDDPACGNYEIGSGQGNDPIAGESSSCVGGDPNATWFFLIDDQGGGGTITIANTPACDTDFVAWGPFDSPADALAACAGGISPANEVGCDFGTGPGGNINVPGSSQVGDVYLMVITNFSDDPGITVTVTAPPLECCPVATGIKADVEICSGGSVTSALSEFEGSAGEITGASQFIADLGISTSGTAAVAPTTADFTNNTCAPIQLELFHLYTCDSDCNGTGDAPSSAGSFMVTIYPDASSFVVTETPGACGAAATVSIATAGGAVCFTDTGTVPPAGTCPSTSGMAPLTYSYDPAFAAACNATFSGTVAADCAPTACSDCPDIAPAITAQEICAGADADFATVETEVNVTGNNVGAFTYFTDAGFATAYAGPLTNATCDPIMLTIYGRLMCTDPAVAGTAEEFDDFSFMLTVYPDANNFVLTEVTGGCGVPASVEIAAENNDICFTEIGNTPLDPGCDNPDDVQDLTYAFDPGFIATCNLAFGNTLSASCATTAMSPAPSFTCPTNPIDFCTLAGPIDLLPMDGNNTGATGTFSGNAAGFVVGNQNPGAGATLDLSSAPPGTYTLEYTLVTAGCPPLTTTSGCTFSLVINCDADGGRF